jgi:hypothetical protein
MIRVFQSVCENSVHKTFLLWVTVRTPTKGSSRVQTFFPKHSLQGRRSGCQSIHPKAEHAAQTCFSLKQSFQ